MKVNNYYVCEELHGQSGHAFSHKEDSVLIHTHGVDQQMSFFTTGRFVYASGLLSFQKVFKLVSHMHIEYSITLGFLLMS